MTPTQKFPFIFSDDRHWRLRRHLAFWLFWWVFQGFLYSFIAANRSFAYAERLQASMTESFIYLLEHIFLAYALIYWVIPSFLLKQRYMLAAVIVLLLFLVTAVLSAVLSQTVIVWIREQLLTDWKKPFGPPSQAIFFQSLMAGLRGGITIGGIAAAIKLMKYWYLKEQRNVQLQQENMEVQMQLLKAQIHPHFLFNTLNNIYSFSYGAAPRAADMVMGLGNLLRYILYETSQPLVPLQKDWNMLMEFIDLERVRYGNRLDIHTSQQGPIDQFSIAPLLLLPLVENCFKHGTSQMIEQPWISMELLVSENGLLILKLLNGQRLHEPQEAHTGGIGLANVRKRLELLYAGRHQLNVLNEPETFIVTLELQLERSTSTDGKKIINTPLSHYA